MAPRKHPRQHSEDRMQIDDDDEVNPFIGFDPVFKEFLSNIPPHRRQAIVDQNERRFYNLLNVQAWKIGQVADLSIPPFVLYKKFVPELLFGVRVTRIDPYGHHADTEYHDIRNRNREMGEKLLAGHVVLIASVPGKPLGLVRAYIDAAHKLITYELDRTTCDAIADSPVVGPFYELTREQHFDHIGDWFGRRQISEQGRKDLQSLANHAVEQVVNVKFELDFRRLEYTLCAQARRDMMVCYKTNDVEVARKAGVKIVPTYSDNTSKLAAEAMKALDS